MTDILTPDAVDAIKRDLDENGHADWCDCTNDFDKLIASHRAQAARIKELEEDLAIARLPGVTGVDND